MLISSSIAAIGLYVFSDHYYAVDARYLTICFIGLFFGGVIYASQKNIDAKHMYYTGIVLVISIIVGILFTTQSYQRERDALATVNKRNNQLATALESRKVDNLIGDYWRVVPTKFSAKQDLNITPLGDCNTPRDSLTSTAWQPDLSTVRFAYLLSFDEKRTDFPQCSVDEVVKNYGQPNASVLIEGTHDKPKEQLLFYDEGSSATEEIKTDPEIPTATVTPVSLDDLPAKKCQQTVMQVVAHQDDDLLFMSPDLPKAINEKKCIRTIYLTSGDGGGEAFYWLGREQGSEAAYSKMLGINTSWLYRMVKISDSQFITIASPKNHPEVSLVYLHLPDGNLRGEGFESTKLESLDKLYGEALPQINSVDSQSKYTKKDLTKLILKLMEFYKPTELRTQSGFAGTTFTDHSDHLTAGKFATEAFNIHRVNSGANLQYYLGYPVRELPENIEPEFVNIKQDAFFDYGKFDSGVCKTIVECEATPTYYDYLRRQYTFPN
jgi:LmbE family N-acetylglucosaminyl deacetylase